MEGERGKDYAPPIFSSTSLLPLNLGSSASKSRRKLDFYSGSSRGKFDFISALNFRFALSFYAFLCWIHVLFIFFFHSCFMLKMHRNLRFEWVLGYSDVFDFGFCFCFLGFDDHQQICYCGGSLGVGFDVLGGKR